MKNALTVSTTIQINAPAAKVWDALVNPAVIKQYFFGTEAISDWKEGSNLIFRGTWEGKPYEDKGIIAKMQPEKVFHYTYFSPFTGKEDVPENYANITYELAPKDGGTELKVTQDNVESEEMKKRTEGNWEGVLNAMKTLLEKE